MSKSKHKHHESEKLVIEILKLSGNLIRLTGEIAILILVIYGLVHYVTHT